MERNKKTIVLAAAFPAELAGIRKTGRFRKERAAGTGFDGGVIHGMDAALFVSGLGEDRAYNTAKLACAALRPGAYISVGFSAALDGRLLPGDVVIGSAVGPCDSPEAEYSCDGGLREAAKSALGAGALQGLLLASRRVLVTAKEKRKCGEGRRSLAVDMETLGTARACAEAGVPFLAVRAISDTFDEDLPVDFNLFKRGAGLDWPRLLAYIMTHPGCIGPLIRLGNSSRLAALNMGRAMEKIILRMKDAPEDRYAQTNQP